MPKSSSDAICRAAARWLLRAGVLLVASGLGASPARAQSAAVKAAAQARLDEGVRLGERGDYAGALRKFQEAYERFPSPKINFNMGQAYRGLARDVDAIESFQKFLTEAKDATPAMRSQAKRQIDELMPQVASVKIACDVDGAAVSIDGRRHGATPLPQPILVAPGPHQVLVEKAGSAPYTSRIDPSRGVVWQVDVRLTAAGAPPMRPAVSQAAPPPALPLAAAPAAPPPPAVSLVAPPPAPAADSDGPVYVRWWFWTAVVVVTAGTVAAVVLAGRDKTDNCVGVPDCYGVK